MKSNRQLIDHLNFSIFIIVRDTFLYLEYFNVNVEYTCYCDLKMIDSNLDGLHC
jgi:hypothetical protein